MAYVRWNTVKLRRGGETGAFSCREPLLSAHNQLIEALPRAARAAFMARGQCVELVYGQVLRLATEPARHAYFPLDGLISLMTHTDGRTGVEVGLIGYEGMLGVHMALGINLSSLHAVVQSPGAALRIDAAAFRTLLAILPSLQRVMHRYTYVLIAQLASSSGCIRYHAIEPRLARRLLMSQDRLDSDQLHVTHETLASTLGVRRVGITSAAGSLQRQGLIRYRRGELTILDREGLERAACSCYAADHAVYDAQLPSSSKA